MRIILLFLIMVTYGLVVEGQSSCAETLMVDGDPSTCTIIDMDNLEYETILGSCVPESSNHNAWLSFVADGPDLNIAVTHETAADVFLTIVRFTGQDCDPVKYEEVLCITNGIAESGLLTEGELYHVIINVENNVGGDVEVCIFNPDVTPPPINNLPCTAIELATDSICILGTTTYAEGEFDTLHCSPTMTNEVWYKFTTGDGLVFGAQIFLHNISMTNGYRVKLIEYGFQDCTNESVIRQQYCGNNFGLVLEYVNLEPNHEYYIAIASDESGQGDFEICLQQMIADPNTDACQATQIVPNQECITFDTYYSVFEYDLTACDFTNQKLWYQFYTGKELNDISLELSKLEDEQDVFLGLGYFQGNFCGNTFVWVDFYCGSVEGAAFTVDDLLPLQVYHIVVGTNYGFTGEFELCVDGDYNSPYTNGTPCTAYQIDDFSGCVSGSNIYGSVTEEDTLCYGITPITQNWYKVPLDRYNHMIDVSYTAINTIPVHRIQVGYFENGCTDSLIIQNDFCNIPQESSISATFPDSIDYAYISVGLPANSEYFFSICVNPLDLQQLCFDGDFCQTAVDQGEVLLDSSLCWEACTFGATRENSTNEFLSRYPSSWYSFSTGQEVEMLKISIQEATFPTYYVALQKADHCASDTFDVSRYVQITDEEFWSFDIEENTDYVLVICAISELGATAQVCLEGLPVDRCPVEDGLQVVNTSLGSPYSGPFQEGEQVSFCYTIESFDVVSEASCQWLQGIVPTFGHSWDEASYDSLGRPVVATQITPLNSQAAWGWRSDVHSKMDSEYRRIYSSSTGISLCHSDQSDCEGDLLLEGDLLPSGWYAWNFSQGSTHPDSTYGDGIFCNANNGPWTVCFDLIVGTLTDDVDLSVDLHTFSDGEIGLGGVPDTSCMADLPLENTFYLDCDLTPIDSIIQISTCSGNTSTINLPEDQYFFWFYIDNDRVSGEADGSGQQITIELTTTSQTVTTVQYFVQGYSNNGCHIANYTVEIDVYPALDIPRPSLYTICQLDSVSMYDVLPLEDYILGDFIVNWNSPILENTPTDYWTGNEDATIPYQVVSAAGCYFQDTVSIHVEDVIVEEYVVPFRVCRDELLSLSTALDLDNLIDDPFTVDWDYGSLVDIPSADTSFMSSTDIPFLITGATGCQFRDTLEIVVPFVDITVLGKNRYCSSDTVSISAGYNFNLPHDRFWIYPSGDTLFSAGIARPAHLFDDGVNYLEFHVYTEEGCPFYDYDTIEIFRVPQFEFNQDTTSLGVCSYDSLLLEVDLSTPAYDPVWTTPDGTFVSYEQYISEPGSYSIVAGFQDSQLDCSNSETFTLTHFPDVQTDLAYDEIVCDIDSTFVTFSNPNNIFVWSTGNFSSEELLPAGNYQVTVSNPEGCQEIFEIDIESQALPNPTFSYSEQLCEGDSTWISTAPDDNYDYVWSDMSDSTAFLTFGGEEIVYVTDELGCLDSFAIDVEVLEIPDANFSYNTEQDTLFLFDNSAEIGDCEWMINDDLLGISGDTILVLPEGDYVVSLSCNNMGCTDFQLEEITIVVVSSKELEIQPWQLYPNPNAGLFEIAFASTTYVDYIEIIDLQGVIKYVQPISKVTNRIQVDSQLTAGAYFLRVQTDQGNQIRAFIIR